MLFGNGVLGLQADAPQVDVQAFPQDAPRVGIPGGSDSHLLPSAGAHNQLGGAGAGSNADAVAPGHRLALVRLDHRHHSERSQRLPPSLCAVTGSARLPPLSVQSVLRHAGPDGPPPRHRHHLPIVRAFPSARRVLRLQPSSNHELEAEWNFFVSNKIDGHCFSSVFCEVFIIGISATVRWR